MTPARLLRQSIVYHWRGNLAVLLGVTVGTAVLTGALLVGDSLRGSLRKQVVEQLGWVDHALVSHRFVRADLADELSADRIAPAIVLRAAATTQDETTGNVIRRAGRVTVYGVDGRFWTHASPEQNQFWHSDEKSVVLNEMIAEELQVKVGNQVTLHLQKVSDVPRESFLGHRDAGEVIGELVLRVRDIIPNNGPGRFNLSPSMDVPRNVFVPLRTLQNAIFETSKSERGRALVKQAELVNVLLVTGSGDTLQEELHQRLTLEDWGLVLRAPRLPNGDARGYLSLESRQMFLEPVIAAAAIKAAAETKLLAAPTLVYLANRISDGKDEIPYSVVAALDPSMPPPLGPFLPPDVKQIADDEIVLVDWDTSPLKPTPGSTITVTYFEPKHDGRLTETAASLRFRGYIPLTDHRDLAPDFPGLTDRLTIREWNPPFEIDQRRIKDRDEHYWDQYRTTPKAYVTLAKGQESWGSRYGELTSIRLASPRENGAVDLDEAKVRFTDGLLRNLVPDCAGLVFDDVRTRALDATVGSADFGMYFLLFSFFLIVAALLLVGLLFRLNLDRRAAEVGLLLATGYRRRKVRGLLLGEGAVLAIIGSFVGLTLAVFYAWFLIELLRMWWPGQLDRSLLRLHVGLNSFLIGFGASLLVSLGTIVWAVRQLGRTTATSLLKGQTDDSAVERVPGSPKWSLRLAILALLFAVALLLMTQFTHDHMTEALVFFGSGSLLLAACLSAVWTWMRRSRQGAIHGQGLSALGRLATRNSTRHAVRSLLTVGLLAFAVFVVIAVESFHRSTDAAALGPNSGTGGFALLGESNLPIYQDLNSEDARAELNITGSDDERLRSARFYGFRLRAGDDASCLNLFQPNRPQVMGVPPKFAELNRFRFSAPSDAENPWKLLNSDLGDEIPAIVDATTAQYILKTSLGGTVTVPDGRGEPVQLKIVGLLVDSIFQSQLLISEPNFLRLYPRHEGFQFYLIDTPVDRTEEIRNVLERTLAERGFTVTPAARRLEAYWAVENTYLATFQALGGLGLLLGALGLGVVLLRTVWERRSELALLRALGYRRSAIGWLLLCENGFLLALGLAAGTVAALVAVLPHLGRTGGELPLFRMALMLIGVLVVGLSAAALATATSLRAALVPALRRE